MTKVSSRIGLCYAVSKFGESVAFEFIKLWTIYKLNHSLASFSYSVRTLKFMMSL
jgi:hypothetical protein